MQDEIRCNMPRVVFFFVGMLSYDDDVMLVAIGTLETNVT